MKLVLIFLFLVSCATTKSRFDIESIGVEGEGQNDSLQIDIKNKNGDTNPDEIDPANKIKDPVIVFNLYSTLYHSQAAIYELKSLEQKDINISVISGYGFGGLIAALYAKEKSVSYIEWKLFALTKKLAEEKAYSNGWLEIINNFIQEEFGDKKADQLKIRFAVPEVVNGVVRIDYQSKVTTLIKKSLKLINKTSYYRNGQDFDYELRKYFSVDLIYKAAYLPVTPTLTQLPSLEYGIYTRYLGGLLSRPDDFGLLKAPVKQEIDEIGHINELDDLYRELIDERTQAFEEKIQKWREASTQSLNQL